MRIEVIQLAPGAAVPNHPRFPALIYRGALAEEVADPAAALEGAFGAHGWPPQWRDGIYDFHHYHTLGHEALGCAAGTARVMLGGPEGTEVAVGPGDVMALPAGTGHCLVEGSADLMIVGAYPPGQIGDICRGRPTEEMLERIRALPAPSSDPLGAEGGVTALWRGDGP
jgi:uncharacterized protein YjlB